MNYSNVFLQFENTTKEITSREILLGALHRIATREYAFFTLFFTDSQYLSIGMNGAFVFVQFTNESETPPNLCAAYYDDADESKSKDLTSHHTHVPQELAFEQTVLNQERSVDKKNGNTASQNQDAHILFQIEGTPTPIPKNLCISRQDMLYISAFYAENLVLPKQFKWVVV